MSTSPTLPATAWSLADVSGRPARCVLSRRRDGWRVVVWRGASLAIWEVHATIDAATRRSCELWSILVRNGWHSTDERAPGLVPGRESYRRGCPECRARAGVVTYRRHGYIVLFCEQCEHGWTDRERTAQGALQAPVLPPHRERRRVA